jgi:Tol biopolymer transport system component
VIDGGFYPRWLASGHLVYARGGGLFVVPFDPGTLEVQGDPVEIVSGVLQSSGGAHYSTSREGTLVYVSGGTVSGFPEVAAVSIARDGAETILPVAPGDFAAGRMSPDGTRMALVVASVENIDVWISDVARGTLSRLTTSPGLDSNPMWTLDGSGVVFASERSGEWALYRQSVDGRGDAEQLLEIPESADLSPDSWTPDGTKLVFSYRLLDSSSDVGVLAIDSGGEWSPLLSSPAVERHGDVSSDGAWITYESNETGVSEIYVEQFPGLGLKTQISTGGGQSPQWSPDGDEIFYRTLDTGALTAVQIGREPTLTVDSPILITDEHYSLASWYLLWSRMYDVLPDGERFLMFKETQDTSHVIHVVLNAFRDLN